MMRESGNSLLSTDDDALNVVYFDMLMNKYWKILFKLNDLLTLGRFYNLMKFPFVFN